MARRGYADQAPATFHDQFVRTFALEFGLFFQVPVAPDQSEAARYADTIEQVVLGDKLGFQTAWLAEGHFLRPFSALSALLVLAAALSQRTQHIRLGTAATLLPLHHPLRVAEEAATVGPSERRPSRPRRQPRPGGILRPWHTGLLRRDYPERFEEAVNVLRQAWSGARVRHNGHGTSRSKAWLSCRNRCSMATPTDLPS